MSVVLAASHARAALAGDGKKSRAMDQCECGHDQTRHNHLVGVGYVGRCIAPMCACMSWRESRPKPDPLTAARAAGVEAARAWRAPAGWSVDGGRLTRAIDALLALEAAEVIAQGGDEPGRDKRAG